MGKTNSAKVITKDSDSTRRVSLQASGLRSHRTHGVVILVQHIHGTKSTVTVHFDPTSARKVISEFCESIGYTSSVLRTPYPSLQVSRRQSLD
jgi:hypothetical protein